MIKAIKGSTTEAVVAASTFAWAGIAAHPWQTTSSAASQSAALETYSRRLNADAALVAALAGRRKAASSVRVVTLPPLTTTRTS